MSRLICRRIIVAEWARADAPAALKAVNFMEPASLSELLEREIADVWARSNPDAVIENIAIDIGRNSSEGVGECVFVHRKKKT